MTFEAQKFKFSRPKDAKIKKCGKNLAPKSEKLPNKAPKYQKINFFGPNLNKIWILL